MDLTIEKSYQIIAIILPIIAFCWEKFLRNRLLPFLERSTLNESFRKRNQIVGWLHYRHVIITSILLGIAGVFGVLSIL